jgi:replicative DNA helicase
LNGISEKEIHKYISEAKQFESEDINKINYYREETFKVLNNKNQLGLMTPYREFNRLIKGIRTSETTVLTGPTGSGKTTFAYNLSLWLESVGMPVLAMSFENKISSICIKLIEILSNEKVKEYDECTNKVNVIMSDSEINRYFDIINNKGFYFLNKNNTQKGYYGLDKIIDIIEYSVKYYDIKFILLDHLHYFLKLSDTPNWVQKMEESVRSLTQLSLDLDIHILIIAHPHKAPDKDKKGNIIPLGLNSTKGSSALSQEADNFLVVTRLEDAEDGEYASKIMILKNREFGVPKENSVIFKLRDNRNTFYI